MLEASTRVNLPMRSAILQV